jgi:hypothetical protein
MTSSILNRSIQKHPQASATFIDGELVVMGNQDNIYYRVNASGIPIWNLLETKTYPLAQIVDFIADYYSVVPTQIVDDIEAFILLMIEKKLFQYVDDLLPGG